MLIDDVAEKAMAALRLNDPRESKKELEKLIGEAPERIDLRHAMATTLIRMGEPKAAGIMVNEGLSMAKEQRTETAATLMTPLLLLKANVAEDLYEPHIAEGVYREILQQEADHPYAKQRYALLLLSWGRLTAGLDLLKEYVEDGLDEPDILKGYRSLCEGINNFIRKDIHPKNFLVAHRESYVEAFNEISDDMVKKGWYAEAARMHKNEDGGFSPIIAEGARPYAAMRVDLVNPENGQPGRIGEGPLIVALAGHEVLSQCPVVSEWPGHPFRVHVSSQCPWNNLAIHIRFVSDTATTVDPYIGDWYEAGFHGSFGEKDQGMLHEISDPDQVEENSIVYYVDCGRARFDAITELLSRLEVLHGQNAIESVLFGKGFLP